MVYSRARKIMFLKLILVWCLAAFWSFYLVVVPLVVDPFLFIPTRLLGFWVPNPYWALISFVLAFGFREVWVYSRQLLSEGNAD